MSRRDLSDWDLISSAKSGDAAAFTEMVRRYERPLVHFCYRMTGSVEEAEDLAQETFIRVHRYLNRLAPRAKFSTVIFGFARNLTLNYLRDSKRRGRGKEAYTDYDTDPVDRIPDSRDRPDRKAGLREIEESVERGIEKLSVEHREVLVLREIHGLEYEAIAEITKCRMGTVKSRLARAREQLRQQIVKQGGELL